MKRFILKRVYGKKARRLLEKYGLLKDSYDMYQILGRLQADCNFYLGYGGRQASWLWAKKESLQIALMFALWLTLPKAPSWLTLAQINKYERQMCNPK